MTDAMAKLENLIAIQCEDGNWNYDAYMQGMANGLILARSVFTDEDPKFLEAPKEWLADRLTPDAIPTEHVVKAALPSRDDVQER